MVDQWKNSVFCMCVLYVLQYCILPLCATIYPSDTAGIRGMLVLTTCIIAGFFEIKKCTSMKWWMSGSILYPILIFLYHPDGIYGIGDTPFVPEFISVLVIYAGVLISLLITIVLIKTIRRLLKKSKQD